MPATLGTGTRTVRLCLAAAATLLASAAVPAAHAAVEMPFCPAEGSTTMAETTVFGQQTRVVAYPASAVETDLCYQTMNSVQFVLVLVREASATQPDVAVTSGAGACAVPVVDAHTGQGDVHLSTGVDGTTRSVCFGDDGATTTVTVTPATPTAVPHLALWLPANSALNEWGWCTTHWLRWKSGYKSAHDAWVACYQQDNQVL
jgi:hypothetical protein